MNQIKQSFNTLITLKLNKVTCKFFYEAVKHIGVVALAFVKRFRFQQFHCFSTCKKTVRLQESGVVFKLQF